MKISCHRPRHQFFDTKNPKARKIMPTDRSRIYPERGMFLDFQIETKKVMVLLRGNRI
jgi:hypothetical protein